MRQMTNVVGCSGGTTFWKGMKSSLRLNNEYFEGKCAAYFRDGIFHLQTLLLKIDDYRNVLYQLPSK